MNLGELRGRPFITVREAASLLGCDDRTVRRGVEAGDLPGVKIGARLMIPGPRLLAMIEPPASAPTAADGESKADVISAAAEIVRGALRALEALSHDDGGQLAGKVRRLRDAR